MRILWLLSMFKTGFVFRNIFNRSVAVYDDVIKGRVEIELPAAAIVTLIYK